MTFADLASRYMAGSDDHPGAEHGLILDAALGAFVEVGIRRTSVGDIARWARISPVTLYRKFPGKQALVEVVVMREIRSILARVDAVMAEVADDDVES